MTIVDLTSWGEHSNYLSFTLHKQLLMFRGREMPRETCFSLAVLQLAGYVNTSSCRPSAVGCLIDSMHGTALVACLLAWTVTKIRPYNSNQAQAAANQVLSDLFRHWGRAEGRG
ncbi:hypothetical protein RRG08_022628 [Elysia crispata]|uniref:Uncharacterized protein n=1 Tax=Elysia crispata TaxID=231223 RepID=A0AAE0Z1L1_9GAST|nr:hypothetical protein RRG08_022628 [Elysia crispata]